MNRISWAVLLIVLLIVMRLPTKTSGYEGEETPQKIRRDIRRINRAFNRKRVDAKKISNNYLLEDLNTKNLKITEKQRIDDIINRIELIKNNPSIKPINLDES